MTLRPSAGPALAQCARGVPRLRDLVEAVQELTPELVAQALERIHSLLPKFPQEETENSPLKGEGDRVGGDEVG